MRLLLIAVELTASVLVIRPGLARADIALEIEGVDDELQSAVRNALQLYDYANQSVSAAQLERLLADAPEEAQRALEPYGFYHAMAEISTTAGEASGDYQVVVSVTPGEQVIVREVTIKLDEQALAIPDIKHAVESFQPRVGEPLNHGAYEGSKNAIATALQANGFFDAELLTHRVTVTSAANIAAIELEWRSNERYRFGNVHFPDTQFPNEFLRRYVPWKPDAYYSTDMLLRLQQRLVDADYFSAVSAQPLLDDAKAGVVPIDMLLIPAERSIYTAGAHVSTDSGPGVRLGIERRWLNRRGHKIGGETEYSQRLQATSVFYRIPSPGQRNRTYSFAAGYGDEDTDSSHSRNARISAAEVLDDWHGYTRTLGLQFLNGDFKIADEQRNSSMLFAETTLSRKRANDLVFPETALSVNYLARFAAEGVVSDTNLAQVRADAKWVRPAGGRSRLILRASLGVMAVDDFDSLPPELRFFAGGDRSIRGFDYQEIGETNDTGGVIGGKYLSVASVEYEHYFVENWGAAVFVDAGDAYSDSFDSNVGAGIGLRWRSPVGIVRLDIARPVKSNFAEDGIRFHVVIGPDL